jgi:hypothetical protein
VVVIAKILLLRILVSIGLWMLLMVVCFLKPSYLGYAGLALLHLWYIYIPFLLVVVSAIWRLVQRIAEPRGVKQYDM